jgi:large subunit ribosomal protein LP2
LWRAIVEYSIISVSFGMIASHHLFIITLDIHSTNNMRHLSVYLMLQLGGNESPTKEDVTKALAAVGVEADSAKLDQMLTNLETKSVAELMDEGKGLLATFGGGGGGGAGAGASGGGAVEAAVAKVEEKEEEVEADMVRNTFLFVDELHAFCFRKLH